MTLRYLLDTNALSEPVCPRPHPCFMRKIHARWDRIALPSTVWHEALFGLHRMPAGRRREEVEEYLFHVALVSFPILPYDAAGAEWHAMQRARLESRGRAVPFADAQVAAVAKVNGLAIVTRDARDFAGFDDVEVENWWR
ncbi:MAG: type II toxin-antitoxin system VapC family toxin [Planctomycetota bacterium]